MIATLGFLLVTTSAATRGTVLVPHPTPSEATVQVGVDAIHLFSGFTLGSCGESVHYVRELGNLADSSFIKTFPGDPVRATSSAFVGIGWSNWSAISPGTTCYTRVRQDTGGTRFRYRKTGDVLVLMDTVFSAIVDTHSVSGWPYKAVVDVRSRWSHAPYDPKQKWVRWVDSLFDPPWPDRRSFNNSPILTLTDTMAIDSIAPARRAELSGWLVRFEAWSRNGGSRWFQTSGYASPSPPGMSGRGVRLPPGTTFRLQEFTAVGWHPSDRQPLYVWSEGKVIDSVLVRVRLLVSESATRRPVFDRPKGDGFDLLGRRLASPRGIRWLPPLIRPETEIR